MRRLRLMKKPRFDLNDAVQHPGRHVTYDVSTGLEEEADLDLVIPLIGELDAVSTGNMLLLSGDFEATVVLECGRCLAPFQFEVEFRLDEQFPIVGTPAVHGGREFAHVVAEDEPSDLFEGNCLLYEDLLRQALWLNLPVKPLCTADCQGIGLGPDDDGHGRPEFEALFPLLDDEPGART